MRSQRLPAHQEPDSFSPWAGTMRPRALRSNSILTWSATFRVTVCSFSPTTVPCSPLDVTTPVTLLDGPERRLPLPLLPLLRPNEQEVEDGEDGREEEHLRHHGAGAAAVRRLGRRVSEVHHGINPPDLWSWGRNRPRILPHTSAKVSNRAPRRSTFGRFVALAADRHTATGPAPTFIR